MVDLINDIPRDFYYREAVVETPGILHNIKESHIQGLYRDYLAKYRNIDKRILEESYMFYILDGEDELDEIIPSLYVRDLLGIQTGEFVKQKLRFVFPIFDSFKTIIGFVGYDYEEEKYKYLISLAKFTDKNKIFFNMQNLSHAYKEDVCIVVEGVFDSLRLNENGYLNNLSLLGKRMSDYHKRVLNRFSLVIIISDNDEEGLKASKAWAESLDTRVAHIYITKKEIEKKIYDTETQKERIIKVKTKDIDDFLSIEENRQKFRELYNRILKDSRNTIGRLSTYSL